jgi:monovalent cation:H+ antiporter-2, CPA2 family
MSFELLAGAEAATTAALAVAAGPGRVPFDMLRDLATIMCVAAVTTVLFQRIRQPVVLGYLMAGVIVGPHLPVPLFADEGLAHQMSELGVVLLMFSLGLEFDLRTLARVGARSGVIAIIECSLMIWLGYLVGGLFGWSPFERLFAGAIVAISSTTIIAKAFAEQGVRGKITQVVFGVLIVEDVIAILLLAVLTPIASGAGLSPLDLLLTVGRLAIFLVGLLVLGILLVPRLIRLIVKINRPETTVVACVGICFGVALLARAFGYSAALGAFLGGALVAESGTTKSIERLVEPVRDVFAAVFFVSVGMLIDPALVAEHGWAILALSLIVIVGKVFGVSLGAFLAGTPVRTSVQAAMSMAQIGEFSFIIAGLGVELGVLRGFFYPVAVAVSALTTLATPFLIRASGPVASFVDSRLPHPVQTFATLYGSWVAELGATPSHPSAWARIRRHAGLLFVDVGAIAVIVIVTSLNLDKLVRLFLRSLSIDAGIVRTTIVAGAGALAVPFLFGAVRLARALGRELAAEALPPVSGGLDLAAAPRRALLVTLQLTILLVAGIPLVAVTQPFVASVPGLLLLMAALIALVIPFWRSATSLEGHVRAGAQVLLEALSKQTHAPEESAEHAVRQLLPGLGRATTMTLEPEAACIGRTLKELDLRGLTGASVIAIERAPNEVIHPSADEALRTGDCLVLAGSNDAIAAARRLLCARRPPPAAPDAEPAPPPPAAPAQGA